MRFLSGIKPTGRPHLGNYFGMMKPCVDLQAQGEGYYFLADLHALNLVRDAEALRSLTHEAVLDFLALGLDPERCTFFVQSQVPEVTELTWILGTLTPMGMLQRAHAYKDALAKGDDVDFGLFAYPVLMAADILAYDSDVVPVGQDQKQHIELTRDMAVKFNVTYCPDFDPQTGEGGALKLPKERIGEDVATVPGTDGRKMSKSYGNGIPLFGADKATKKAIMRIVTDSTPVDDPKDPETCNVFALLRLFLEPADLAVVAEQYRAGGTGYGAFKTTLLDAFHARFADVRARRVELAQDLGYVEDVLARGAQQARETASVVLDRVRNACGIRAPIARPARS